MKDVLVVIRQREISAHTQPVSTNHRLPIRKLVLRFLHHSSSRLSSAGDLLQNASSWAAIVTVGQRKPSCRRGEALDRQFA